MANALDNALDWWPSPAKLNLFLHINGRYDNGYHQLQSLFQMLDQGDSLHFEVTDSGKIALLTPIEGVDNQDNLIVKAALALQTKTGCEQGVQIRLNKHLPMGGGIGGGSSNAATVLVALNHLWQLELSEDELAQIGLTLGADVPIFVRGKTAFAEGVGELISPVVLQEQSYLVMYPDCHVSTAEVFQAPDLPRSTPTIDWQTYSFENTRNDCQEWVIQRYPKVAKLLRRLLEYAPSRMTGTGACVFATFDNVQRATEVLALLSDEYSGFVAKGVNQSPLLTHLAEVKKRDSHASI